ncbi:MAG: Uma2 family endonuclease [Acidobacteriota bacterium]|nr:Uma2 family endonuclease [Acidobacteriota bacterium]
MIQRDASQSLQEEYYTIEEYLSFERASEIKHEYVDGQTVAMVGASRAHNLITGNVSRRLGNQLEGKPCETYSSDMRVKTTATDYTYPDVIVVCEEPEFEDREVDTLLNPTVIVEVLSKSTEKRDRVEKFADYRGIAHLKEYILISQDKMHVEHYVRQPDNEWRLYDVNEPGGKIRIESIDCELLLSEVYERVKFVPQRQLRKVAEDAEQQ